MSVIINPSHANDLDHVKTLTNSLEQQTSGSPERLPIIVKLIQQTRRSNPNQAEAFAEQGFLILKQFPSNKYRSLIYGYIAKIHLERGDMKTAGEMIATGLSFAKLSNDDDALSVNLFNQALIYQLTDKLVLALDSYLALEPVYQKTENHNRLAAIYNNIGNIYDKLGNLDDALAFYQKALPLYKDQQNKAHLANTIMNIGQIFYFLGDNKQAEANYLKGLTLISKESAPLSYAEGYQRLGILNVSQNKFLQAKEYLQNAVGIAETYNLQTSQILAYYELIKLGNLSNDLNLMRHSLQRAEEITALTTKSDVVVSNHFYRALVSAKQEKWSVAEAHIDKMLESGIYDSRYFANQAALDLAFKVKTKLGQFTEASNIVKEALERFKQQQKETQATLMAQSAQLYKTSEKERKIAVLEEQNTQSRLKTVLAQQEKRQLIALQLALAVIFIGLILLGIQRRRTLKKEAELKQTLIDNKNQMLADISHELRTPFSVLKLQVEALQYNIETDTDKAHNRLHNKISQLTSLIEDIDELAQADAFILQLNKEPVRLKELIKDSVFEMQPAIEQAQLRLKTANNIPERLTANLDKKRLKQVITNLLTNSIKYTDTPGLISIIAKSLNASLIIVIEDSSPSVPPKDLNAIFGRLYRVDKSRNRETGGSGLGLSICRSFVELHEGTIIAEPSELGGLKITISIPI